MKLFLTLLCLICTTIVSQAAPSPFRVTPLETRLYGQNTWLRGGPASLRIIVQNHTTGKPVPARVTLSLAGTKMAARSLFTGKTSALGTIDAAFVAPKIKAGAYTLKVNVESPVGNEEIDQPLNLAESVQILLSSDKPLYQPGQTMHLRALALDSATRQPLGGSPVTFEVEDARGNKIFKSHGTLSRFGVASADLELADEVNMGSFTLRAITSAGQAEKTVRVERYVLPKFKVTLTTDKPYYLPGQTAHGTVEAHYFFGKPLSGATVTLAVNTVDIGVTKLGDIAGTTDATGKYKFDYTLPNSFVGQPFEQGKAVVEFAGTVKDTANQTQTVNSSLPVVKDPVLLLIVPEHQGLVPGVENRVFIAAATPDGQPLANFHLTATASGQASNRPLTESQLTTDAMGLTMFAFAPPNAEPLIIWVSATDTHGNTTRESITIDAAASQQALILRTDKTLAKVGDRLTLAALSSAQGGTLYLDVVKNKQTILTRAVDMAGGQATLSLPITDDMTGTLELHAYKILPSEDIIRDTRTIIVAPADDLTVKMTADQPEYKPGGDATLRFAVTGRDGSPIQAVLGLAMVDESVFALSELKPGLEKVYFNIEKELMEPKYEIHGLTPTSLFLQGREDKPRQRAAAMLLASAPVSDGFDWRINSYQTRVAKVRVAAMAELEKSYTKIRAALEKFRNDTHSPLTEEQSLTYLVTQGYLNPSVLVDPWGHWYKANLYGQHTYQWYFSLTSAGPDGIWGTADDLDARDNRFTRGGWFAEGIGGDFAAGAIRRDRFEAMEKDGEDVDAVTAEAPVLALRAAGAPVAMPMTIMKAESKTSGTSSAMPRIRSYFPETMYWNPDLITDDSGHAELHVPIADSITTWRISMLASGLGGQLGSGTAPVKVFQDFFVDMDLPIALTRHDSVEIPVTVYNYLPHAQSVTLTLADAPWFTRHGPASQTLTIGSGEVKVVSYPITVQSLGRFALTVTAQGTTLSDAVRRVIDVLPDGKEFNSAVNDRLDDTVEKTVSIPADAIPGATKMFLKLYPGTFSQLVEGLDGMLRMPSGCFEQTSSTTYPNVLALDYLKATKKINPEVQMKAESYINIGYQRLVTFECKSGGFSWFGNEPAHQVLTAYGLLEFSDMARVHDVDPALIARTQAWLAGKQHPDGSWLETSNGIAEGIINRQTGSLRTTAYVAWALAESGYTGAALASGVGYVKSHLDEAKDPYTLAVILNLLAKVDKDGPVTADVANRLIALAKTTDKAAWWEGGGDAQTFTGASGSGADLETTGLAAYGLLHWGRNAAFTEKVLTRLVQSKDAFGTWGTTQGTVWSLKSLLYASRNAVGGGGGTLTIIANGAKAGSFKLTPDDSDVMRQADLSKYLNPGDNTIRLEWAGQGSPLYQIATRWYQPWVHPTDIVTRNPIGLPPGNPLVLPIPETGPLSLSVAYDKTQLAQNDTATVTATIKNVTDRTAEMPLIDLGIPPGFTLQTDGLEKAVTDNTISKYTQAARQIIVYLEKLGPGQSVTLTYGLKAKYPIHAQSPQSKVYPYYNPERVSYSAPQMLTVSK